MAEPFLKWAGGKRWIAARLAACFHAVGRKRYIEPFLGSGAVFFALESPDGLLSDVNHDLIGAFCAIRDNPDFVIRSLAQRTITQVSFTQMRDWKPLDPLHRAVRLIYLNKTAFNGIYRVNQNGDFNVPFGCKPGTRLCQPTVIRAASEALQSTELRSADFRVTLKSARATDAIYIDPPYTVKHDNNGFRRYNEKIFSWEDQCDLARLLHALASEGAAILISNANHDAIRRLYRRDTFARLTLTRASLMSGSVGGRGTCTELLLASRSAFGSETEFRRLITASATESPDGPIS